MHFRRKKTLMDRAQDYVDSVLPQIEAAVGNAVEKAGPALTDARDRAKPLLAEGKALAAEKAAVGATLAADKAALGRDLAAAKVAELKGEPEPQGGKLKKVVLFGGLAALGAFIVTKLRSSQNDSANWQSSYVPTPAPSRPSSTSTTRTPTTGAPTPPSSDAPPVTDDLGGGAPGEAMSDSIEEPQAATSPDNPAEVVDINGSDEGAPKPGPGKHGSDKS